MVEVQTDKLDALEADAKATEGKNTMNDAAQGLKSIPEPLRTILMLFMAVVMTMGGGAAGQSVFGISEEKMEKALELHFQAQDRAIEAKFEVMKARQAGKDLLLTNAIADLRELKQIVREMDKRLVKEESRNGGD